MNPEKMRIISSRFDSYLHSTLDSIYAWLARYTCTHTTPEEELQESNSGSIPESPLLLSI